ncbi:glycosyltransferase [Rhodohalobacter barkolensis]|uniref:Glycosyltransferase n=1 Tax=Rhodohalobacter barkolensis TaxID=2053187 RepID=A0A2N0VIF8_9BACT|nr:glycosyltransferase [Rhodohalobacter barkolensis]PKD43977.1 glycosyltransferase [Rhodohalobacter barkolensis]
MDYSVIVPIYNRPDEIDELLQSLTLQTYGDFEVLVIEDGSTDRCDQIVEKYSDQLSIRYFYKENSGQGFSRNFGFDKAAGDYFVVFDSDCIIPPHYFESVNRYLAIHDVDCWGGPDRAHQSFSPIQKAISFSMTSFFTTGGIRGRKNHIGTFHPRSFNMGISQEVYKETGGYKITRMGEDIEFSLRIINKGFKTGLIEDAYVYHKRRTDFKQFYHQLHFFGRARINIKRFYPNELKLVHLLPVFFVIGLPISLFLMLTGDGVLSKLILLYPLYALVLFIDAATSTKDLKISFLGMVAGFIQLTAYGIGFLEELSKDFKKSG